MYVCIYIYHFQVSSLTLSILWHLDLFHIEKYFIPCKGTEGTFARLSHSFCPAQIIPSPPPAAISYPLFRGLPQVTCFFIDVISADVFDAVEIIDSLLAEGGATRCRRCRCCTAKQCSGLLGMLCFSSDFPVSFPPQLRGKSALASAHPGACCRSVDQFGAFEVLGGAQTKAGECLRYTESLIKLWHVDLFCNRAGQAGSDSLVLVCLS